MSRLPLLERSWTTPKYEDLESPQEAYISYLLQQPHRSIERIPPRHLSAPQRQGRDIDAPCVQGSSVLWDTRLGDGVRHVQRTVFASARPSGMADVTDKSRKRKRRRLNTNKEAVTLGGTYDCFIYSSHTDSQHNRKISRTPQDTRNLTPTGQGLV